MGKWEMVRLGVVCDVRDGTHDSPKYVTNGYPLVTSKNVTNGYIDITDVNYISKDDYNKIIVRSGVDNGDIIMPMIGTIGNPVVVHKTFDFAIKNVALIKFISNNVLNKYIFYILSSSIFKRYIKIENRGGTQKFISLGNIRNFMIPLPPLEIQKQIAKTLDTAAELLAMRKQQLAELDNLIKSTFYDMFGDPVTNDKRWEIKTIAEVSKQKLSYGSGASAIEYDGLTRYVRITDINDNGSLNVKIVSPSEISEKYNLTDGDILFARSGATVGKTLRYRNSFGKCIYAGYLIRLIPNECLIFPDYVYYFTKTDYYKGFIESNMKTVAQPNINAQQYGQLKICVPPLTLQTQFSEIVTKIEEQKILVKKAIDETQYLFDSLMSEYFE